MKKILLVLAAVTVAAAASAEGYQVNNLSSKQNGMGHVGTAMKLNSESLWFNPAAAVFQDTKFDISVGVTGIASKATYTSLPDYTGATKPVHYTSDNKLSTPMFAYVNYKPLDWMSVGVAFNTPFGSSMNWGDDWAGSQLIQSINLAAYNFQPTVSFRIGKHFSIGGGLMLTWGNFDLSRSLLPIGADNAQNQALMGALQMLVPSMPDIFTLAGNRNLMSLGIEGSAKMAVGVNLGVMWDINEQWSLGMNFRSKQLMKVDSGSIDLRMIDDPTISQLIGQLLPQLGLDPTKLTSAVVRTELPLPASMTGASASAPCRSGSSPSTCSTCSGAPMTSSTCRSSTPRPVTPSWRFRSARKTTRTRWPSASAASTTPATGSRPAWVCTSTRAPSAATTSTPRRRR